MIQKLAIDAAIKIDNEVIAETIRLSFFSFLSLRAAFHQLIITVEF